MTTSFFRPLNYKKEPKDNRDYIFKNAPNYTILQASRPSSIDWSRNMTPVKDQGTLGSCVAFSIVAMKEWQEIIERRIAEKDYGPTIDELSDLSESYVYWNAKKLDPWPNEEGTAIKYAMQVLQKNGVPTEKFWPYFDNKKGEPLPGADEMAQWTRIGSYWRLETLEEILTALSKQPVPIGIMCFDEFFNIGKDGIVPLPKNPDQPRGGHAICLVGYDDEKKLLKFKNSWGESWGANGYGYLPYEYSKYFLDCWTCLDLKITDGKITPTPTNPIEDEKKKMSKLPLIIGGGVLLLIALISYLIFR